MELTINKKVDYILDYKYDKENVNIKNICKKILCYDPDTCMYITELLHDKHIRDVINFLFNKLSKNDIENIIENDKVENDKVKPLYQLVFITSYINNIERCIPSGFIFGIEFDAIGDSSNFVVGSYEECFDSFRINVPLNCKLTKDDIKIIKIPFKGKI